MKQHKPNCFEKTKVRWGIFKKLSCTNVDLEHVRPLATNVLQLPEGGDFENEILIKTQKYEQSKKLH